jgi:hypothetical protein
LAYIGVVHQTLAASATAQIAAILATFVEQKDAYLIGFPPDWYVLSGPR